MRALLLSAIALVLASPLQTSAAPEPDDTGKTDQPAADRSKLEKDLAERLSNSRLVGFYMIEGQNGPPRQDSYTLGKVAKGEGDKWVIHARIEYRQKALMIPLELPIYWAGETPVITVTDFTVPGMGTYTARVMIHGSRYVGTWSSPNHGGFLWGHIERISPGSATRQSEEKKPQ